MPLTAARIKHIHRQLQQGVMPDRRRFHDERGLYLEVPPAPDRPTDVRSKQVSRPRRPRWRFKYRYGGKEKVLALGTYPDVSLADARRKRDEARQLLADGIDPAAHRRQARTAAAQDAANTFQAVAEDWRDKYLGRFSESHQQRTWGVVRRWLLPSLGKLPIAQIGAPDLLRALRAVEAAGKADTAKRARQVAGQIFRWGVSCGLCAADPTPALAGAMAPVKPRHMSAPTDPAEVGALLRMLQAFQGSPEVRTALLLAPYLFARPGELCRMKWADVDLEAQQWGFTLSKTHRPHIVPLAPQVVALLRDLWPLTGRSEWVFPSPRGPRRPITVEALTAALRRLGIGAEVLHLHGWRAVARTLLDERLGFPPHIIEQQLGHEVRDPLGRSYNRTAHLDQRKRMMAAWADYLDGLRDEVATDGATVVPLRQGGV